MSPTTPFTRPENLPASPGTGPEWLSSFILNPPPWVNQSLKAIAALAIVIVAYRVYQFDFRLPVSTQIEMQRVVAHVLGVMIATLALNTYADLPFVWNVSLGALIGVSTAFAVQPVARRIGDRYLSANANERAMAGWVGLLTVAVILPGPAGIQENGYMLLNTRWYIVVLCVGLAFYNVAIIKREERVVNL